MPTIIEVRLVIDEKEVEVAPGARIWAMTFAGTVQGPMIVVHENDFTNRNTTFMTWNLMHLGRMLKEAGGIPAHGNQRSEWDAGCLSDRLATLGNQANSLELELSTKLATRLAHR